jgi:histo-blood group ABO system transferase
MMNYKLFFKLFFLNCFIAQSCQAYKIGLLVVATGRYIQFVSPLIKSANKYFCTDHEITFFIFTDGDLVQANNIVKIYQSRLGWPYDTLMRCSMYYEHRELLEGMDYLFASDADMLFVDSVGDEILSERVSTQHPGYVGRRGTYETQSISTAYIKSHEGKYYFAGGFYGGSKREFLKMAQVMTENIKKDFENNFIAVWHDESHLNRYFIDNPPTKILSPSYCYPESWKLNYPKKLLALDKNHQQIRSNV